jgi:hypothetical protein
MGFNLNLVGRFIMSQKIIFNYFTKRSANESISSVKTRDTNASEVNNDIANTSIFTTDK